MTPENQEFAGEADTRERDWAEFFEQFQSRETLEPHHNVEVKELFAQEEAREGGEMIFYHFDFGSFWMQYGPELYENGQLVHGNLEVNPSLLTYIVEADYIEVEPLLEESEESAPGITYSTYLEPVDEIDPDIGTVKKLEVPAEYNLNRVDGTIKTGIRIIDKFRKIMTRFPEDYNLSRNT